MADNELDARDCLEKTGVALAKPGGQITAMEAVFKLVDAVNDYGLSITDLEEIFRVAVAEGHGAISIVLGMAGVAMERAGGANAEPMRDVSAFW